MLFFTLLATTTALIQNCNTSSVFQITDLGLTPDPPVPGEPFVMTLLFDNPDTSIPNGTITSSLSLNYVPFPTSTVCLCNNTECPIPVGKNDRSTKSVWPSTVTGRVTAKTEWYDETGNQLLCIHTSFTVASSFWRSLYHYVRSPFCQWITC
jgi:hypothetical protein